MSSSRRVLWLSTLVAVLAAALVFKLWRSKDHGAPWQLPVCSAQAGESDGGGERDAGHAPPGESRYSHAEIDLLPLSVPRGNDGDEQVAL